MTLGTNDCLLSIGAGAGNVFGGHALSPLGGAKPIRRSLIKNCRFRFSVISIWRGSFSVGDTVHSWAFLGAKLGTAKIFEDEIGL